MIGVFDSGFGGLTVLKEFLHLLPEYDYIYLGDNARAPYGNRSHATIKRFTKEAIDYLFGKGCKLIIIACNTASSQVLREIQEEYLRKPGVKDRKILGVIRPLAEKAAVLSKNHRIGVVGTRSTINAGSYKTEISNIDPKIQVYGQACPLLVPLIEENWYKKPEAKMILRKYLLPLKTRNIDTMILGCTHYPFMQKDFRQIMGKKINVPNPGKIIAESLKDYLKRHPEIEKLLSKNSKRYFCTTDDIDRFQITGSKFLGQKMENISNVNISD